MKGAVQNLGGSTVGFVDHLGRIAVFTGLIVRSAVLPPYRLRRFVDEVYDVGALSLVIICLSGTTVGAVLALQGYSVLTTFGAESQLGTLVGQSLIRELGPVLTGLLVTGRAGSAMAAGIASMVQTEQLDGLRMMSIDPVDYVVRPKALAMVVAVPLLSALFVCFGLFGGYMIGVENLGLDGGSYLTGLEESIQFADELGLCFTKALVFGVLMGLIATYRGFIAEPTAVGVSRATTETVVAASIAILLADYTITALWGL